MKQLTAMIQRDGKWYVAQCVELDIASQGDTRETALSNLKEAVELFFATADPSEIERRLTSGASIETLEVAA